MKGRQSMSKQNLPGMIVRISHQPIDICPLCKKRIDGSETKAVTRVVAGGKLLFYAHRKCVGMFNDFIEYVHKGR